jgi:hypothetical protein
MRVTTRIPTRVRAMAAVYYDFLLRRAFSKELAHLPCTRSLGPMKSRKTMAWVERRMKKRFLRGVMGRIFREYRRLYGCSYQFAVREDRALREYMAEHLAALPCPEAFGIDAGKWRRVIDEWRKEPKPYRHLTRHFFWLLFFKRWHDMWGKYVSI